MSKSKNKLLSKNMNMSIFQHSSTVYKIVKRNSGRKLENGSTSNNNIIFFNCRILLNIKLLKTAL